jgi:acyl-CoA reductase-like NAD-dependent aldehyde dehydrogenase
MDVTARRIIWAKTLNAGQSCVAPDYVLVDRRCRNDLIEAMKVAITDFFGPNPKTSSDYGRIINRHRYDQLVSFIVEEKVAVGGDVDADQLYIAPTILTDITANSPIMQHEILGPVLPIMEFENIEDAISLIKQRPAPLAAYVFTHDRQIQNRCIADITCGGVCINDAIVHLFAKHLPFGGVGDSGIGKYHGKASFDNFTHYKTVLRCSTAIDLRYRYPPQKVPLQRLRGILRFLLRC